MRLCISIGGFVRPSVGPLVCQSVRPSVGWSVTTFFKSANLDEISMANIQERGRGRGGGGEGRGREEEEEVDASLFVPNLFLVQSPEKKTFHLCIKSLSLTGKGPRAESWGCAPRRALKKKMVVDSSFSFFLPALANTKPF